MGNALQYAPAVVVAAKADGGTVVRGGDGDGLILRIAGSDQILKRIDAGGSEHDIPARWRGQSWWAWDVGGGDPAVMLEREVVGREVILVGDYAEAQLKLLLDAKSVGGRDQVRGQTAREEIARGAGGEQDREYDHESGDGRLPHLREGISGGAVGTWRVLMRGRSLRATAQGRRFAPPEERLRSG